MSKKDSEYFIDSDKLYDYVNDSLIATDEWESIREKLENELHNCDSDEEGIDEYYREIGIPFLNMFKFYLEKKLIRHGSEYGFGGDWFKPESCLEAKADSYRGDYKNPDIEAALAGLVCIKKLKNMLINNGKIDRGLIKIFLLSIEMSINLFRAGEVPKLARVEVRKTSNSINSRDLKKEILHACLKQIFNQYPKTPKTLGGVWRKIDLIKTVALDVDGVSQKYNIIVEKDELLFTGIDLKKPLKYAKRSLEPFIKSLK